MRQNPRNYIAFDNASIAISVFCMCLYIVRDSSFATLPLCNDGNRTLNGSSTLQNKANGSMKSAIEFARNRRCHRDTLVSVATEASMNRVAESRCHICEGVQGGCVLANNTWVLIRCWCIVNLTNGTREVQQQLRDDSAFILRTMWDHGADSLAEIL